MPSACVCLLSRSAPAHTSLCCSQCSTFARPVDVDAIVPQQQLDHLAMAITACGVQRRGTLNIIIRPVDVDAIVPQ